MDGNKPMGYNVRQGGLMRCCLLTLDEAMLEATEPPKEGDKLQCKYHRDKKDDMIFRDGAWEWNRAALWDGVRLASA